MNIEIVKAIEDMYREVDTISKNIFENKVRDLIREDMINFLLYIAYTNNNLSFRETAIIAYYFDFKNLTPEKGIGLIRDKIDDIKKYVPESLKIVVCHDNYIYNSGIDVICPVSLKLYALYKRLGNVLVFVSKYLSKKKKKNDKKLLSYLVQLQKYIVSELKFPIDLKMFEECDNEIRYSSIDSSSPGTTDGYYFAEIEDYWAGGGKKYKEEHFTLEQIVKQNPSYRRGIEHIQDEFLEKGYEKFFTIGNNSDIFNMKRTEEYILESGDLKVNKYIAEFIEQFSNLNLSIDAIFLFPESYCANYFEAKEVCKNAKIMKPIKNIFPDEDNIHWLAVFEKKDILNVLNSGVMDDNFGGYKLFGYGLPWYADNLQFKGTVLQSPWIPDFLAHFQGYNIRRKNPYKIIQIRNNVDYLLSKGYFKDELELYRNLYQILMPFFQKWYKDISIYEKDPNINVEWKTKRIEIKSELVEKGIIKSKWKHERTLFELVRKIYPDALYQYRPNWLGQQSLDIYIPQLSIGIEYQGIQHYESIEFFGGEEGLKKRKELDRKKKGLCIANDVRLIEWNYNVEPTKENLKKMILM